MFNNYTLKIIDLFHIYKYITSIFTGFDERMKISDESES